MKKILFLLFLLFSNLSYTQWNIVNIGTTQDLYSVDYHSMNDIWIGSFNQFIKTTNGGSNWVITNPMTDMSSAPIIPANVNDLCLINSSTAIATGLYYMGNSEVILKTVNGGANWDQVSLNNSVPLLRYINSVDMNGSLLISVGNTGRIFRSTNAGSNWTLINSGTTAMIYDVKFSAVDTLFASGTNIMLRSFDGGLSWQSTGVSGDFENLDCEGNVIYAVEDYGNGLIKSTDNGITFSNVSTPFLTRGGIYCVSKDTVLASGSDGLYITKDGGISWEKYVLSNYQPIKMIDFLSPQNGYAVGLGGYVLETSNLIAAPTLPIASFNISGSINYCLNDNINLNNTTANLVGYTYQWKDNGITFSTSYNANLALSPAGNHTIELIVTNSNGSDSVSQTINVIGNTILPINLVETDDSVCVGNYMGFYVQNSQTGVSYQLRNGMTNIGVAQSGNGNTLIFSCGSPITTTTTFNVKATKTSVCFVDTLVASKTIYTKSNPATPAVICTPANSQNSVNTLDPGINRFIFGDIDNSSTPYFNHYYNYTCCYHTDLTMGETYSMFIDVNNNVEYLTVWMDLNNNGTFDNPSERIINCNQIIDTETVFFTIPTVTTFNQNIRLRVVSNSSSFSMSSACSGFSTGEVEDYSVKILPAPILPIANFTFTTNESCTTTANITNTSYNATDYVWDFGDGSPLEYTQNVSHVYSLDGNYTITLIASNPTGSDTISQNINVVIPLVPIAACTPSVTSGYCPTNDRPYMIRIEEPSGPMETLSGNVRDYTCDIQFNFLADSVYYYYVHTNNQGGYMVAYIDANANGVFEQFESLASDGFSSNYGNTGNYGITGPSNFVSLYIPAFAKDSTPLRMRIFTSSSFIHYASLCNNYCGDYKDFTVFATAHSMSTNFTVSQDTVCMVDSVAVSFINTSLGDVEWLWDFGDGDFSTAKHPTHYYTSLGTYTVKLRILGQNGELDSIAKTNFITITQGLPVPNIVHSNDSLYTNANAPSYVWYRNNVLIPGASDSLFLPTLDGVYKVGVVNSNGCITFSSNFSYYPPRVNCNPLATVSCAGAYTYLNNSSTNCTSYIIDWGDGTTPINWSGTGGPFHIYTNAGVYTIKLVGCNVNFGCDSLILTNYITVNALPVLPVISYTAPNLSCASGYTTYQWYRNGSTLSGATTNSYTPTLTGNYTVKVTNVAGCNITSAIYAHYPIGFNIYADTTNYCGVNNANVSFVNTTTNASSYLWYFGDGDTSSLTNPTHFYANPGTYDVKLVACGTNCDSITLTNYIVIDPIPFSIAISPNGPLTICNGNSIILYTNSQSGVTYQWQNNSLNILGETDTIINANLSGNYSLIGTNSLGCIANSNIVNLIVDWNCVWPGDADNSYEVDNYDILPLGLYYGFSGNTRGTISNNWQPFASNDWGTQWIGMDIKHIDCNGDGIIDDSDTLAINQNFSNIHLVTPTGNNNRSTDPNLYCVSSTSVYTAGDWVDIDIMAGSTIETISNLYGIAFEMGIDYSLIEPGTASIIYSDSWLTNQGNDGLTIRKIDISNSNSYFGLTRKSHTSINGYGKLGTFRFQVLNSLTNSASMTFNIVNYYANDEQNNYVPFDLNNPLYISIEPSTVGVNEILQTQNFEIYPNPFNDELLISYELIESNFINIEILNSIGQTVYHENKGKQSKGKYNYLLLESQNELPVGIYFVKLNIGGSIQTEKIIKTN